MSRSYQYKFFHLYLYSKYFEIDNYEIRYENNRFYSELYYLLHHIISFFLYYQNYLSGLQPSQVGKRALYEPQGSTLFSLLIFGWIFCADRLQDLCLDQDQYLPFLPWNQNTSEVDCWCPDFHNLCTSIDSPWIVGHCSCSSLYTRSWPTMGYIPNLAINFNSTR